MKKKSDLLLRGIPRFRESYLNVFGFVLSWFHCPKNPLLTIVWF